MMINKGLNSKRGSMSIFLLMLFLSLVLLVSFFVNAAGYYSGRSYSKAALDLAGRSVLAEYLKPLQKSYGIFAVRGDADAMKEKLYLYAQESFSQIRPSGPKETLDVLGLKIDSITVDLKAFSLLDISIFENQILEQMKYRIFIPKTNNFYDIADEINQGALLIDLTGKATAVFQKMGELGKIFALLLKAHERIAYLEAQMKQILFKTKESDQSIEINVQELKKIGTEIRKNYEILTFNLSRIKNLSKDLLSFIDEFDYFIKSQQKSLMGNLGSEIIQKVTSIKAIVNGIDERNNQSYEEAIEKNVGLLKNFENSVNNKFSDMSALNQNYNWTIDFTLLTEFQSGGIENTDKKERYIELTEEFNQSLESSVEGPGGRILRNEKVIKGLPSAMLTKQGEIQIGLSPDLKSLLNLKELILKGTNLIQINEYILIYMMNHQSEPSDSRFFNNEVEYVLFGDKNDQVNYDKFKINFLILRASLNMLHIYSNAQKRSEVAALAAGITPGPWALCTELIIATAWASVEAENDLKLLEAGDRIVLVKNEKDWAIGLESLLNLRSIKAIVPKDSKRGLLYQDYLRLFLILEPRENKILRIMDLIQLNIKGSVDESFNIKDYYCGFAYHAFITKKNILPKMSGFWLNTIETEGTQLY